MAIDDQFIFSRILRNMMNTIDAMPPGTKRLHEKFDVGIKHNEGLEYFTAIWSCAQREN